MPGTAIARSSMHSGAPSFARCVGPACNRISMGGFTLTAQGAIKFRIPKQPKSRHLDNARWITAAAAVEPDVGDQDDTAEDSPAPRLTPGQQRRARRKARLEAASAEGGDAGVQSKSVGPRWGASRRRGPMDKRNKIKKDPQASADAEVDEAAATSNSIRYGEVASGKKMWYLLQVTPNRENVAARAVEELNGRHLENTGGKAELEVLVPVAWEEGVNPRTGRVSQMKTLLVPGYCMVKCVMDNDMHTLLRQCYHVKGYAGNATKITGPTVDAKVDLPLPMPDRQLKNIFAAMNEEQDLMEKRVEAKPDFPFEEGDIVTVTDGPYKGFSGQVMGVDAKESTVSACLVIFSRATDVVLSPEQIEKASPKVIKQLGPR